jgi:ABC-type transport system involved in cytochrome bd biosynthesis fused ATPase/permease subunit
LPKISLGAWLMPPKSRFAGLRKWPASQLISSPSRKGSTRSSANADSLSPEAARAILRNPRILILDDALSSVDTLTEEKILTGLARLMRDRTTILISHRVSTVQNADRIIVLEHGTVVEIGTHESLQRLGGYYAGLYRKQLLEEELEAI